ncbi:MAG: NAD-dependent epimerase/dehydratase family protein, partial [Bacteroidota bacterium]
MNTVLVTGANGQIGTVLVQKLQEKHGRGNVIASDLHASQNGHGPFESLDVLDRERLLELVERYQIDTIYHLAAILSASGEKKISLAWQINMDGLLNVLEVARTKDIKVFAPSSIAVFGDHISPDLAPQHAALYPGTVYGISKVAGEL